VQFLREYFSLGAGGRVAAFILGIRQAVPADVEMTLLLLLLVVIVLAGIRRVERDLHLPVVMLLCYFSLALGLYFLPAETWAHHWVIGTPFQYAAIALFIPVVQNASDSKERLFLKAIFVFVLAVFGLSRLSGLTTLEQAYQRGDASTAWSPSLTRLGKYEAEKSDEAVFIAGDWGVANQMISFVNGRPKIVYPVNWTSDNIDTILRTARRSRAKELYFVFPNSPYFTKPDVRTAILAEVTQQLAPQWQEAPLDPELKELQPLIVIRLVRK
jgi:hypothetical protein